MIEPRALRAKMGRWRLFMPVVLLLSGCGLQERLLYYPERHLPTDAQMAKAKLRFWPAREGYRGFMGRPPEGRVKGTVVVLHGNAATAAERVYYLEPLRSLGYRVLLAEYPGYGAREGKLGETSFARDAAETVRLAAETYRGPIFLLGESLGGAVAASAVGNEGLQVDGLILATPWDTLESVAREKFPWLPVRLFLVDRYDTPANLRKFQGPLAVVVAERDEIISPRHAEAVFRGFSGPKRIWRIRDAGHNDWSPLLTMAAWGDLMEFMDRSAGE